MYRRYPYEITIFVRREQIHERQWSITVTAPNHEDTTVLHDPFTDSQHGDYAWYLEQYVQQNPFAETRAKEVARSIKRYGRTIIQKLRLEEIAFTAQKSSDVGLVLISISVASADNDQSKLARIYWEILEDAALWETPNARVAARRLYSSTLRFLNPTTDSQVKLKATNSKIIRILLLLARDISGTVKDKDEPEPSLALKVLLGIDEWLRKSESSTRLQVEVVRPGSLESMSKHLQVAHARHGFGYYQAAHLDVHGVTSKKRGSKLLLNVSDPAISTTREESPEDIARLLNLHGIKIVILNACRSASTTLGSDASIAQTMLNHGCEHVLAMSFKITATAASVFLLSFYYALLVTGQSLSWAVSTGRQALLKDPTRHARLRMEKDLLDYAIPVLYSSSPDSDVMSPSTPQDTSLEDSGLRTFLDKSISRSGCESFCGILVGRDFDLLRLEQQLIHTSHLYFSGRAGIGKTILLRHAAEIWKRTRLVELVVFVEFTRKECTTYSDFLKSLIGQLSIDEIARLQILEIKEAELAAEIIWNKLQAIDSLLILDGLQNVYSYYTDIPRKDNQSDRDQIDAFLRTLFKLQREASKENRVFLVVASRWSSRPCPFSASAEHPLEWRFTDNRFHLSSLRLADAMSLAQTVLSVKSASSGPLTDVELQELELVLGLLDGNPSAIIMTMQLKKSDQSWAAFRNSFERGSALEIGDFASMDLNLTEEIFTYFMNTPLGLHVVLFLLGFFWSEVPPATKLWEMMQKYGPKTDIQQCSNGLLLASDRGYIQWYRDEDTSAIPWVHPVFTVMVRIYMQLGIQDNANVTHEPDASLEDINDVDRTRKDMISLASIVICALDVKSPLTAAIQECIPLAQQMRRDLASAVENHVCSRSSYLWLKGYNYNDAFANWSHEQGNLSTVLRMCLEDDTFGLDVWPIDYLGLQLTGLRQTASPTQLRHFTAQYAELFSRLLEKNGGKAFKEPFQRFSLVLTTTLTAIYKCELHQMEDYGKYSIESLDIIKASEDTYGPYQNSQVLYVKAMAHRYRALWHMDNDENAQASTYFQSMLKIEEELFRNPQALGHKWSDEEIEALAKGSLEAGGNIEAKKAEIKSMASGALWYEYHKSRRGIARILDIKDIITSQEIPSLNSRQLRSIFANGTQGMSNVLAKAEAQGMRGLQEDERWWPEDLHGKVMELADPRSQLRALEDAENSGDYIQASRIRAKLANDAVHDLDFRAAHIYAQRLQQPLLNKAMFDSIDSMNGLIQLLEKDNSKITMNDLQQYLHTELEKMSKHNNLSSQSESMDIWKNLASRSLPDVPFREELRLRELQRMQAFLAAIKVAWTDANFVSKREETQLRHAKFISSIEDAKADLDTGLCRQHLIAFGEFLKEPQAQYLAAYYDNVFFEEYRTILAILDDLPIVSSEIAVHAEKMDWHKSLDVIDRFAMKIASAYPKSEFIDVRPLLRMMEVQLMHIAVSSCSQVVEEEERLGSDTEHLLGEVRSVVESSVRYLNQSDVEFYISQIDSLWSDLRTARLEFALKVSLQVIRLWMWLWLWLWMWLIMESTSSQAILCADMSVYVLLVLEDNSEQSQDEAEFEELLWTLCFRSLAERELHQEQDDLPNLQQTDDVP